MSDTEIWWLSLAILAAGLVVVAVLLGLVIETAKSIDRHAAAIWMAGKEIAGNTVSIWLLEKANEQLAAVAEAARSMERKAASIDETLREVAAGERRQ